jgi:hypothetical protein
VACDTVRDTVAMVGVDVTRSEDGVRDNADGVVAVVVIAPDNDDDDPDPDTDAPPPPLAVTGFFFSAVFQYAVTYKYRRIIYNNCNKFSY